jgi:hypothetical protein
MADSNERIEAAYQEIESALEKTLFDLGELLARKFNLQANELFAAMGKATLSNASKQFMAAVDGGPADGIRLRQQLSEALNKWLAEMNSR